MTVYVRKWDIMEIDGGPSRKAAELEALGKSRGRKNGL